MLYSRLPAKHSGTGGFSNKSVCTKWENHEAIPVLKPQDPVLFSRGTADRKTPRIMVLIINCLYYMLFTKRKAAFVNTAIAIATTGALIFLPGPESWKTTPPQRGVLCRVIR